MGILLILFSIPTYALYVKQEANGDIIYSDKPIIETKKPINSVIYTNLSAADEKPVVNKESINLPETIDLVDAEPVTLPKHINKINIIDITPVSLPENKSIAAIKPMDIPENIYASNPANEFIPLPEKIYYDKLIVDTKPVKLPKTTPVIVAEDKRIIIEVIEKPILKKTITKPVVTSAIKNTTFKNNKIKSVARAVIEKPTHKNNKAKPVITAVTEKTSPKDIKAKSANIKLMKKIFQISSPLDKEILHNLPTLFVDLAVEPKLRKNDTIQLVVDGRPLGKPSNKIHINTHFNKKGVHEIYAILIKDKKSFMQSNVITVYMREASKNKPKKMAVRKTAKLAANKKISHVTSGGQHR